MVKVYRVNFIRVRERAAKPTTVEFDLANLTSILFCYYFLETVRDARKYH